MSWRFLLKRIKESVISHWLILVLALFFSLIVIAPVLIFPWVAKGAYQGISIVDFGPDQYSYISRGREVLEGHGLGNTVLREGKEKQDWYFTYNELVTLTPLTILGLSDRVDVTVVYDIYNFIGVFVLLILIYAFVFQLSNNKLLSALCAAFVVGGYSMVYDKKLFFDDFIMYGRALYPYISSVCFFLYLNFLVKCLKSPKRRHVIYAGLAFAYLFYVYFFAWSFALTLNGVLFLIFLCRRDWGNLKKISLVSLTGLCLGAYNLIKLFSFLGSDLGHQFSYFMWSASSRAFVFSKVGAVALFFYLLYAYKKRADQNLTIILALILSGWIVLNQQLITGRTVQYGHYYWYFVVPISIIVILYMVWQFLRKRSYEIFIFAIFLAVVVLNAGGGQYKSFLRTFEDRQYEQNYRPLIDVLNKDKTSGVILNGDRKGLLFTVYTVHDLFWDNFALVADTPFQRIRDALFVYLYLNKDSRDDVGGYLKKIMSDQDDESSYKGLYRSLEGYSSGFDYQTYNRVVNNAQIIGQHRDELIASLVSEYKTKIMGPGIGSLLRQYGVNYLVWDKNLEPEWDLTVLKNKVELFNSNNIYLYSLKY